MDVTEDDTVTLSLEFDLIQPGEAALERPGNPELSDDLFRLLDVADDCFRKLQDRTEEDEQAMIMVRDALDAASAI